MSESKQNASVPDHFHHWRIEEPNGPMSKGVCKICGVEKEHKNNNDRNPLTTHRAPAGPGRGKKIKP
jgi:hypothetical protein